MHLNLPSKRVVTCIRLAFAVSVCWGVVSIADRVGSPHPPFHEMVTVPIFLMLVLANPEELSDAFRCYIGAAIGFAAGWQISFPERIGILLLLTLLGWFVAACFNLIKRHPQTSGPPTT